MALILLAGLRYLSSVVTPENTRQLMAPVCQHERKKKGKISNVSHEYFEMDTWAKKKKN